MKKILAMFLAVIMIAGSLSIVASAELNLYQDIVKDDPVTPGNIDGEGNINAKDSNLLKSYIAGREGAAETIDLSAADLNSDKSINTKDSYLLKSIISGKIESSSLGEGKATYMLTIGGVDITEFTIYAPEPEGSDNNATYAAELMRKYVRVATGVDLQIKTGTPEGHAIVFNKVERHSELGEKLKQENYLYTVENGNLNIYGTYRGNMYAVYEILETYLGYRFFDSDYTYLYKNGIVDIPEGTNRFFETAMKFRYCGQGVNGSNPQVYYFPARMNGTQIYNSYDEKYGTLYGPQFINAHSYGYYWRMTMVDMPADDGVKSLNDRYNERLAAAQKLWDADPKLDELAWQPCATDEDIYQRLFTGMVDTIRMIDEAWGAPNYAFTSTAKHYVEDGQKSMSFSLCDNEKYCTCRNCRIKMATEGPSGTYLDMSNKAARDLQTYNGGIYKGMRIHSILYNHAIPKNVRPDKNVIVFYCGQGCNNHFIDSGECVGKGQLGKENNIETCESLKAWGQFCKESGAEMWFWYYGVTYHYVLAPMPNVLNLYYDIKFLYEECNVRGFYYEGGGSNYHFGKLKAYLAMKMMWEPTMSYEQYAEYMKEYMHMYYGDGYEELYQFILMQNQAGDECGTCFISNFDRPGDMYSYKYIRDHYEEMRQLLVTARSKAVRREHIERLDTMLYCFDFLGLSCVYFDWYRDGDDASRALYEERYTDMFNYITSHHLRTFSDSGSYPLPSQMAFDVCPIVQVYGTVERNEDGSLKKVTSDASRRAAVNNFFVNGVES